MIILTIFFSLKPAKSTPGLRGSLLKIPIIGKSMSNIKQKINNIPVIGRILYDLFNDYPKIPLINTKATRIFYSAENRRPDFNFCEYAFTYDYDEELKDPRHLRLPYYKLDGAGKDLIKKRINFKKIKKEKTKFCAFVYSNNIPFRNKFFKKLSKYKRIDAPENSMNNMPSIEKLGVKRFIPTPEMGNWQNKKIDLLKTYKFVIAFENASHPRYTTEKIYHPMLANAIPIY